MKRMITTALALLVAAAGTTAAQRNPARGQRPPADTAARNRAQLEQQVRQRLGNALRQQLALSDEQMRKIQETNQKYEPKRRLLNEQERDIRMSLRDELIGGDSSRQGQVNDLMDRMLKVQQQRLDLLEQEQKDLSGFLTPMQRAQYFGMEERVRQQMQAMRQQGGRAGMPGMQQPGMQPGMGQPGMGRGMGQPGMQPGNPPLPPQCAQLTPQQRQRLIQRRARGQSIPPAMAQCLPPGEPPPELIPDR